MAFLDMPFGAMVRAAGARPKELVVVSRVFSSPHMLGDSRSTARVVSMRCVEDVKILFGIMFWRLRLDLQFSRGCDFSAQRRNLPRPWAFDDFVSD